MLSIVLATYLYQACFKDEVDCHEQKVASFVTSMNENDHDDEF